MRVIGMLAGLWLLAGTVQAQTLKQADSVRYQITGETDSTLQLELTWFDGNPLTDTLGYRVTWLDMDATRSARTSHMDSVVRVKTFHFSVTKPQAFTATRYSACVQAFWPHTTWLWYCTALPYVNFSLTGYKPAPYPAWQGMRIRSDSVYTTATTGDSAQVVFAYRVEAVRRSAYSDGLPDMETCAVYVTRNLQIYQPSADTSSAPCHQVAVNFFNDFGWKRGWNPAVQQQVDAVPVPAPECHITAVAGFIARDPVCP